MLVHSGSPGITRFPVALSDSLASQLVRVGAWFLFHFYLRRG